MAVAAVELDGAPLDEAADRDALDAATSGWVYDAAARVARVKLAASEAKQTVVLGP